jgi:four helix bundle protein
VVIAHGSLAEVETLLAVAKDLNYIDVPTLAGLSQLCDSTGRMLGGLRRKLAGKIAAKHK